MPSKKQRILILLSLRSVLEVKRGVERVLAPREILGRIVCLLKRFRGFSPADLAAGKLEISLNFSFGECRGLAWGGKNPDLEQ